MERNWLIRTTQNQILGPVSKQKVVEFIEKGALGLTDEISSGNGYWFGINEKDLLDKYVFGDVAQSYNPISEAQTVLANQKNINFLNPQKTTPIKTQAPVTAKDRAQDVVLPKNDDLEFPDMESVVSQIDNEEDITRISSNFDFKKELNTKTSMPEKADLEFPEFDERNIDDDVTRVTLAPRLKEPDADELKFEVPKEYRVHKAEAPKVEIILPDKDDLEFPDMDAIIQEVDQTQMKVPTKGSEFEFNENTNTKIDPASELNLELDFTRTVALKDSQAKEIFDGNNQKETDATKVINESTNKKVNLYERKTKTPLKKNVAELRDPRREQIYNKAELPQAKKRNDTYLFFILFLVIIIIVAVFYYFKEILNKPFPV